MNIKNLEKKEKSTVEFIVEVTAEEFEKAVNAAYLKMRKRINVPGFRKGKAPRKIIEGMYGASIFYDDALEELYPEAYTKAIVDEKLEVVGRPSITNFDVKDDKSAEIKFSVTVYPEAALGQYKGLEAPKPAARVLKAEIEEELENVRRRNVRVQTVEREAKITDTVNIDYEGFLDGAAFEGGKADGYDLTLGSGYFVPGFEDQLVGSKAGDEKDLDITFPENYAPELAGKAVVFKVKVNEVKENILPDLDDEFAKDVSEFETLDEYKANIKEGILERKKAANENAFRQQIMDKLIANLKCDVPDAMIDERIDADIDNYNYRLMQQGVNFDNYLQMLGLTMEGFRENARPAALKELQQEIALDKIAELEGITASDDEIKKQYEDLAAEYNMELDEVKAGIPEDTVKQAIGRQKASDFLYNNAVVEKKAAKKAKDAE